MTNKQNNILQAALQLFAEQGYNATATSKVAKAAGVSEGLIFRHFGNKEGLLKAVLAMGEAQAMELYTELLALDDPLSVIRASLSLPLKVAEGDYHFWRLLYGLKWQAVSYDDTISAPLRTALEVAFAKLNYPDPASEAELVQVFIDGMATAVLLRKIDYVEAVIKSVLTKYNL